MTAARGDELRILPGGSFAAVRAGTDRRLSLLGAALLLTAVVWISLSGAVVGGDPLAPLALVVGSGLIFLASSIIGRRWPVAVPLAVVAVGAALGLDAGRELFSPEPLSQPFGYANAKGAFFVVVAAAGLMTLIHGTGLIRIVGLAAAAGSALVPLAANSLAASLLLGVIAAALVAHSPKARQTTVVCYALLVLAAVVATTSLGTAHGGLEESAPASDEITQALSERRLLLWNDAIELMIERPVLGVGPGRYAQFSPVASSDSDTRWAHNEYLQAGAELGVPGALLLVTALCWGFARLRSSSADGPGPVVAAAALAAVGVGASVDYILHFPDIAVAAAALAGSGAGFRRREIKS